ncbi:hypothetical protein GBO31_14040 [Aquimarina litoralis]|nr:hypothetical protein [Aquimarina litoralis]
MTKITDEVSFIAKRNNSSLEQYSKCLKKYSDNFEKELSLETKTPIFLDTNVLLRYYTISFAARKSLFNFIKKHKKRIIITKKVQHEFINNRQGVINRFFKEVTNQIPKDFDTDLVNKTKSFLDNHKVVLKDYPYVEKQLEEHKKKLEDLLEKLNQDSNKKRKENKDLMFKDEFLDLLNSCEAYNELDKEEEKLIKIHFDRLKKEIENDTVEKVLNKQNLVFPGFGDIKEKAKDPYGDYVLYHEIMKYMLINKVDTIFLTFDNSKGDWMSLSKEPYTHYFQNIYANTGGLIYILDAERTLKDILKVDIDSLVNNDTLKVDDNSDLTKESLEYLLTNDKVFKGFSISIIHNGIIEELKLAGYNTIKEIRDDLNRGEFAFEKFSEEVGTNYLHRIGKLRVVLRIVNPNYIYLVDNSGRKEKSKSLNRFSAFRKFVLP